MLTIRLEESEFGSAWVLGDKSGLPDADGDIKGNETFIKFFGIILRMLRDLYFRDSIFVLKSLSLNRTFYYLEYSRISVLGEKSVTVAGSTLPVDTANQAVCSVG